MQVWSLLLFAFSSHSQFIKDSTVFYTLKENETMVQTNEHHFMHFSKGQEYVFATYTRGVGNYVRTSAGKVYGPYTKLEGDHVDDGVWLVYRGLKGYLLNIETGQETGPFNYLNDPKYEFDWEFALVLPQQIVAAEPLMIGGKHVLNVNGKIYATGVSAADTITFRNLGLLPYDGKLFYKYESYYGGYKHEGRKIDSINVAAYTESALTRRAKQELKKKGDSLFVDGKFYALVSPIHSSGSRFNDGYHEEIGSIFHTRIDGDSMVFYRDRTPLFKTIYQEYANADVYERGTVDFSIGNERYCYLLTARKVVPALSYAALLSDSQLDMAQEDLGTILINDEAAGAGFNLTYESTTNQFLWISVHGRTLYLNRYSCRKF